MAILWSKGEGASINFQAKQFEKDAFKSTFLEGLSLELKNMFLWVPVCLALGILLYFALPNEPTQIFITIIVALIVLIGWKALGAKENIQLKIPLWALFFCIMGFTAASFRTSLVEAPILDRAIGPVTLVGQVEHIEQLGENEWRLIVNPKKLGRLPLVKIPYRIRLRSRTAMKTPVVAGSWIEVLVRIMPPPGPSHPEDHDFARDAFFDSVGGTGFTLSEINISGGRFDEGETMSHRLNRVRNSIKKNIEGSLNGQSGAIATALTTGLRGGISKKTTEDMRGAGLAHLLAISGLHMALVTGILFMSVRALLAAIPYLALNLPIKQLSALTAWFGGLGYYFLSGGSISTARAFLMVTIVLVAIFLNRKPISMRLVAFAGIFILLTTPEALLTPGFQMSFAAVIGLIAGFEYLNPWISSLRKNNPGLKGVAIVYFTSILLSTLIAEVSIGPVAAWHFQKMTLYGLAANLIAVPLMAFWVMPLGVLALVLTPLGLDGLIWPLMGWGIDQILAIAHWTVSLPNAVIGITPLGPGFILTFGLALVWLCFVQQKTIRNLGLIPLIISIFLAVTATPMADIQVTADGKLIAIKGPDGLYYFNNIRSNRFARSNWLDQNAQSNSGLKFINLEALSNSIKANKNNKVSGFFECDNLGCVYKNGPNIISFPHTPQALERDCQSSDLIITALTVPRSCSPPLGVIGYWQFRTQGAHSIRFDHKNGEIESLSSFKARGDRPWVRPKPIAGSEQ